MADSTLETVFIEVLANDDNLRSSLERSVTFAKAQANQIQNALRDALSVRADTGIQRSIDQLTTSTRQLGTAAAPVADRIDRIRERLRTLDAQYRAGQVSTEQYASRLNDLQSGLERTSSQAGLTQANLRSIAEATIQARAGLDRVARDQAGMGETANQIQRLKVETAGLRAAYQAGFTTQEQFRNGMERLLAEAQELSRGLDTASKEYRDVAQAARTARASLDLDQGNIPKLGLAANVAAGQIRDLEFGLNALGLRTGNVSGLITGLAGALGNLGGAGAAATAGMAGIGIAAGVAGAAVIGVGAAATALTRRGIPEVQAMEQAFNVLRASGETNLGQLEDRLRALQEEGGRAAQTFSRSELAQALAETVKAGVDANAAFTLLQSGIQLAAAEGEDLSESTAKLLTNLRQFGLGVDDAARAADALAAAGLAAVGTAADLSEGLATVGPVARAMGFSIEQTLALLTALDQAGLSAATEGATGLRAVLTTLLDPSAKARETIASLGVNLRNADGTARDTTEVLKELRVALENDREAANRAAEVFENRGVTAILSLGDSVEELEDILNNSLGALRAYADEMSEGLTAAQLRAKKALDDLSNTFSQTVAPAIAIGADGLANFIRLLDDLANRDDIPFLARLSPAAFLLKELLDSGPQQLSPDDVFTINPDDFFIPIQVGLDPLQGPATLEALEAAVRSGGGWNTAEGELELYNRRLTEAISIARDLKAALDAAVTPASYIEAREAVEDFTSASEINKRAFEAVNATFQNTRTTLRSASEILEDVRKKLAALDEQGELFAGLDVDDAKLDAVRAGLIELTTNGFSAASTAARILRADYIALGGEAEDLARATKEAREAQVALAEAFTSKIVLQTELGFLPADEARRQLEQAIGRLEGEIAAFGAVDLSTGEARAELDALIERLRIAEAALEDINDLSLDSARTNFAKLVTDIQSGRQSLESVRDQLDLLVGGLTTKLASITSGGLTALEITPFIETSGLLEDVRARLQRVQEQLLQDEILQVRMGFRPSEELEADLRARLAVVQDRISNFRPSIPIDLNLSDTTAVRAALDSALADAPDEFRELIQESERLLEAIDALATARGDLERAFASNLTLSVDLGIADRAEAQAALEAQLAELQSDLRDRVLQADLRVGGSVDPALQADIDRLTSGVEFLGNLLDRVFGREIPTPDIQIDVAPLVNLEQTSEAAARAFGGILSPQITVTVGDLINLTQTSESAARAFGGILTPQIEVTTGQLISLVQTSESAARAFGGILAPQIEVAVAELQSLVVTSQAAADAFGGIAIPDIRVDVAPLINLANESQSAADAFGGILIPKISVTVDAFEVLRNNLVPLTNDLSAIESEIRSFGNTAEREARRLDVLRRIAVAVAAAGFDPLTFSVVDLTEAIQTLGSTAGEDLENLRTEILALGTEESTFDQLRNRVRGFLDDLTPDELDTFGQQLRALFSLIDAAEFDATQAGLEALREEFRALGEEAPTVFDSARDKLSAYLAELASSPEDFSIIFAQFEELNRIITTREQETTLGKLREEVERLAGVGPTAFENLRVGLEELRNAGGLTEAQLRAIAELLDLLGEAEGAAEAEEAIRELTATLGSARAAVAALNEALEIDSVSSAVGVLTNLSSGIAGLIPGGAAFAPVIQQAGGIVEEFVSFIENVLSRGGAAIDAFIEDRAAQSRLLTEEAIRSLTVLRAPQGFLESLFGPQVDIDATEIGVGIAESIAKGMASAFDAETLEEFRDRFLEGLRRAVIDAAIEAAILDASLQQQIAELAQAVAIALEDGIIDAGEAANIDRLGRELQRRAEDVWRQLQELDLFRTDDGTTAGTRPGIFQLPDVDPFRDSDLEYQSQSLRLERRTVVALERLVEIAESEPDRVAPGDRATSGLRDLILGA